MEKFTKIKQHLAENKTAYLSCAATGIICAGVTAVVMPKQIVINDIKFLPWHSPTTNIITQTNLKGRMHPGIRLLHNETGVEYPSVRYAAEHLNLDRGEIYRHLKGKLPNVDGNTFTHLGEMVFGSQNLQLL